MRFFPALLALALAMADLSTFAIPRHALAPRQRTAPAEWSERSIYLDARNGSVPGYYSHSRFPYSRAVLDAFGDPYVEQIDLNWATQLGKTTNVGACVCWVAENDPAPTMIGCANEDAAQSHYKTKLEPMLESVASIRRRLPAVKNRRTWKIVNLGNMWIWYAWPGSKATVSDRSIKYLFINEVSLWKAPLGLEGDPVQMAMDRTKGFHYPGPKILIEGKPTIEGECRLTGFMENSRKHTLYVPCPACGTFQPLVKGKVGIPGGVKWEEDYEASNAADIAAETVYWECAECGVKHQEKVKPSALRRAVWVADGQSVAAGGKLQGTPAKSKRHVGFHLNSLYSTIATWRDFARRWVSARSNVTELQAVVNGWLAETWKRKQKRTRDDQVKEHQGGYKLGTVPSECLCLVLTVDVQETEFWYVVRAWGWLGNSWLVTYGIVKTWEELEAVRGKTWPGKDGEEHHVFLAFIDSAYQRGTTEVYDWCRERVGQVFPIRGNKQYSLLSMVRRNDLDEHDVELWHIDAGHIRDQFYDTRLSRRLDQPGAWSIPDDVMPDYIRSICAWRREEKKVGDEKKKVWVSHSPDFEHYADCEFMQEAFAFVYDLANRRPMEPASPIQPDVDPNHRAWIATQRI